MGHDNDGSHPKKVQRAGKAERGVDVDRGGAASPVRCSPGLNEAAGVRADPCDVGPLRKVSPRSPTPRAWPAERVRHGLRAEGSRPSTTQRRARDSA